MRHRSTRSYTFRLSIQLMIFGLWTVFFGFIVLYFSLHLMAAMTSFDAGILGAEAGINLEGILVDSIVLVYRGGFLTLGVGGTLMVFGSMFVISVVR